LVLSRCIGSGAVAFRTSLAGYFSEFAMLRPNTRVPAAVTDPPRLSLEPSTISDWHPLRKAIDVEETLLRRRTFKWLATLPAHVRPMATARQYARIVNRIGDLWAHCEFTRLYFQSLLIDRRPGREGLPSAVRHELEVLQDYYFEHLSGLPAMLWDAVPVAAPKIPHKVFAPHLHSAEIDIVPL
jgi:hypothetical protein